MIVKGAFGWCRLAGNLLRIHAGGTDFSPLHIQAGTSKALIRMSFGRYLASERA